MNQNWIVENLNNAFSTWNGKLTELWGLVTTSPQTFKGGAVWGVMQSLHNALIGMRVMANCYMDSSAATWVYFDEIHVLLKDSMSADFLNSTWKRFRKYNAYATGITQDIQDYLANPIANALLSNSEFVIMLRQTKSLDALKSLYGLSNPQLEFLRNASEGHGIIKMGNSVLPFTNLEPKDAAYQIFKGDLHDNTLSNIKWGDNVTHDGQKVLGHPADKAKALTGEAEAKAFASEVAQYLTDPAAGTGTDSITGLAAGYYLIKNTDVGTGEVFTDYILQVVENVTVQPKSGKPTLDKQIKHNDNGEWGVVGDNQIGDTVEFRTITTVPIVSGYTKYTYVIHDEMSAGLTSNVHSNDDVTIKVNDEDAKKLDKIYYTVTVDPKNANKFTVTVDVLKAIEDGKMAAGDTLYTYYTGILNENAKVYNDGKQDNKAYLEYSNNPHDNKTTNKTPEKVVYDWTFKMEINKIDGESNAPLSDAKFVLSKNGSRSLGTIGDDGTPSNTKDLISLIENSDGSYTVAPAGHTGTYVMTAGNITIKGLDDATEYYLYETKAPAGYNRLTDAVKFKITADYDETGKNCTSVTTKVNEDAPQAGLSITVKNNKGAALPSTGGIGTTIFYVIGGVLMAVAAVLLVTKKRMNNK